MRFVDASHHVCARTDRPWASGDYDSDVEDESDAKPGNGYEELLWQLARGPVPLGRIFLIWVALVVCALVGIGFLTELTDQVFGIVGAAVSIPYFFIACPLWASRLGRRREEFGQVAKGWTNRQTR